MIDKDKILGFLNAVKSKNCNSGNKVKLSGMSSLAFDLIRHIDKGNFDHDDAHLKNCITWQPIKTIPYNGYVLVAAQHNVDAVMIVKGVVYEDCDLNRSIDPDCLTHWMPIPDPPKPSK